DPELHDGVTDPHVNLPASVDDPLLDAYRPCGACVNRKRATQVDSRDEQWDVATMASNGIKDRVAIIGMGCTKFGEHWDKGADDLLIDAAYDAYASAGIDPDAVDAYWLGPM